MTRPSFEIAGHNVRAGMKKRFMIPFGELPLGNAVHLPLVVLHGKREGPTIWLNAALHGDELNGIEIIRSVLAIPIVNVHGFLNESRYLPDRRD